MRMNLHLKGTRTFGSGVVSLLYSNHLTWTLSGAALVAVNAVVTIVPAWQGPQSVRSREIRTMRISRTPSSTCKVPSGTNPCFR